MRIPALAPSRPDPAALSVVLLWVGFRLAPFVPAFDWEKIKDALRPLFIDPQVGAVDLLRYVTGWLVVGYAVRLLVRREYALTAMFALVGLVLAGRLVVVGAAVNVSELAALAACVPLAALLLPLRDRRCVEALAALAALAIVAQGLAPFELLPQAQEFNWVPFSTALQGNAELTLTTLLEKFFWCFALIWLLARCGWGKALPALATAGLLATIEIVQMWLPGRSPDILDPLLALAAGVLLAMPRARVGLQSLNSA